MGKKAIQMHEWFGDALRGLVICIVSLCTYFVSQLGRNIEGLTTQLKVMEVHQVEADKRIQAIEVNRDSKVKDLDKMATDVQEMKLQISQMSMRVQIIADVMSKVITERIKK